GAEKRRRGGVKSCRQPAQRDRAWLGGEVLQVLEVPLSDASSFGNLGDAESQFSAAGNQAPAQGARVARRWPGQWRLGTRGKHVSFVIRHHVRSLPQPSPWSSPRSLAPAQIQGAPAIVTSRRDLRPGEPKVPQDR